MELEEIRPTLEGATRAARPDQDAIEMLMMDAVEGDPAEAWSLLVSLEQLAYVKAWRHPQFERQWEAVEVAVRYYMRTLVDRMDGQGADPSAQLGADPEFIEYLRTHEQHPGGTGGFE